MVEEPEKATAPHSSTLAWKIPSAEEPVGCSPWGCKELDTTEWLHFHFSLSCTGEGNGNPLQCSCLENPRDRGTWWAAIYGVAQNWTRLKWLSSSSSKVCRILVPRPEIKPRSPASGARGLCPPILFIINENGQEVKEMWKNWTFFLAFLVQLEISMLLSFETGCLGLFTFQSPVLFSLVP